MRRVTLSGEDRDGGEEFAGVGMRGSAEDLRSGAGLHDLAGAHDGNARGELRDDGKTVRNEQDGELKFALEILQEFEDLRADGDVEGADRLVGDDQPGAKNQRAGDADALALSAGKFVRVTGERVRGETHSLQSFTHTAAALVAGELRLVNGQRLADDGADALTRVERSEGVLKHHLHLAAQRPQSPAPRGEKIFSGEVNFAGVGVEEAEKQTGQRGFAAAGFADEGESFAGEKFKGDSVDGDANAAGRSGKSFAQLLCFQQRRLFHFSATTNRDGWVNSKSAAEAVAGRGRKPERSAETSASMRRRVAA